MNIYIFTSKSFTINGTIWLCDYTFRSQTGANNGWRWFKIVFDFISILILFNFELVHQLRHHISLYPVIPTNNRNKNTFRKVRFNEKDFVKKKNYVIRMALNIEYT